MFAALPRRIATSLVAFAVLALAAACGTDGEASSSADEARPSAAADVQDAEVLVYKSPACGCCGDWVEHLEEEGFEVRVEDRNDLTRVKDQLGVPRQLRSCHTAIVGDYLVEGHVPASDMERLLAEGPEVSGLAVPGMPVGSPGMEVPGREADAYDVLTFDADGRTTVFSSH